MGRIFEKRKERMFARWANMAKAFTKMGKEIAISVKIGGANPDGNPRLRIAIQNARNLNMPKDRIESAIKRASAKDEASLHEIRYEGYGPYGVALLIESATDNPTRTVANVRSYIAKYGGSLGQAGSVDFLFERKGIFQIKKPKADLEALELELIDHGLEEFSVEDETISILTDFGSFGAMQKELEARKLEVLSAGLQYIPTTHIELSEEQQREMHKLIERLEDDDDIQHVWHTMA
jgi:YebC/PmpR family DNA-binding regulatory protein